MTTFELLKKVCESYGPSGREAGVRKTLQDMAERMGYACSVDTLGNLICHKPGMGAKLMFSAHMDSLGMIVTYVEEDGQLRFGNLGGLSPWNQLACAVRFENGVCGTVNKDGDAELEKLKAAKMYIDIGARSREEALSMVSIGDVCVYDSPIKLSANGKMAMGAYLDDRAGCVAQLLAMSESTESENDLYFVFSVQEELGLRGAKTATFAIDPDAMFVCDVTHSDDGPKPAHRGSCKAFDGACIKVMDSSVICHPQMIAKLEALAKENGIKYAMDVITVGGTDAGAAQLSLDGVPSGGASVPNRYMHSPMEMCALSDIEDCARLMAAFANAEF